MEGVVRLGFGDTVDFSPDIPAVGECINALEEFFPVFSPDCTFKFPNGRASKERGQKICLVTEFAGKSVQFINFVVLCLYLCILCPFYTCCCGSRWFLTPLCLQDVAVVKVDGKTDKDTEAGYIMQGIGEIPFKEMININT